MSVGGPLKGDKRRYWVRIKGLRKSFLLMRQTSELAMEVSTKLNKKRSEEGKLL